MIGIFYGTRPEYIKLESLFYELDALDVPYILFQVMQHKDLISHCNFDFAIPITSCTSNRLSDITASVLRYKIPSDISHAVVQGDTTTSMAVALNAFNEGIPVLHLEAGLRTFKKDPFPEEANRRIISSLANVHYCPTKRDALNIIRERQTGEIEIVGNSVIDRIKHMKPNQISNGKALITMHRRENLPNLKEWFLMFERVAELCPFVDFVFPMHPNPEIQKHAHLLHKVKVVDPLPYEEMVKFIAGSDFVITDSGGIQEECSHFKKRCFVCREATERPCESGVLCKTPQDLIVQVKSQTLLVMEECPFGNGTTGKQVAEDIYDRVR